LLKKELEVEVFFLVKVGVLEDEVKELKRLVGDSGKKETEKEKEEESSLSSSSSGPSVDILWGVTLYGYGCSAALFSVVEVEKAVGGLAVEEIIVVEVAEATAAGRSVETLTLERSLFFSECFEPLTCPSTPQNTICNTSLSSHSFLYGLVPANINAISLARFTIHCRHPLGSSFNFEKFFLFKNI